GVAGEIADGVRRGKPFVRTALSGVGTATTESARFERPANPKMPRSPPALREDSEANPWPADTNPNPAKARKNLCKVTNPVRKRSANPYKRGMHWLWMSLGLLYIARCVIPLGFMRD